MTKDTKLKICKCVSCLKLLRTLSVTVPICRPSAVPQTPRASSWTPRTLNASYPTRRTHHRP